MDDTHHDPPYQLGRSEEENLRLDRGRGGKRQADEHPGGIVAHRDVKVKMTLDRLLGFTSVKS